MRIMGNCNWSYRSDGTKVRRGGGGETRLAGITAIENQINEIVNPQFNFEGSEKQKAWANDIVKQVYEGMVPKDIRSNISRAKDADEKIRKYPNDAERLRNGRIDLIKYETETATRKFNAIKDSINYEKAIYDGALKQLSASDIIKKRGNFQLGHALNNGFYRKTYTSRMEQGRKAPSIENGIAHFLEAFKKAPEY